MTAQPQPWLLFVYPWMPYGRRVLIYLRERKIPQSAVAIVRVYDPHEQNATADPKYPPKPAGSLPILAVPNTDAAADADADAYTHIGGSLAIIAFIEEAYRAGAPGFPRPAGPPMNGFDALSRARHYELLSLADELMSHFNGVRVFGTGAGNMKDPPAAAELLRWIRRAQHTIEGWLARYGTQSLHEKGSGDVVSVAEIVLFNFFEFLDECYLVNMAKGSGKTVSDPYGNSVVEAWPRIEAFVEKFKSRECVKKDLSNGEMPSDGNLAVMRTWWEKPE